MCSKLGDFLDHGVDSLADPLAVLMIAITAQGGYSIPLWLFLIGMILVCFMNYVYLWSDKHTKVCFVSDVQLEVPAQRPVSLFIFNDIINNLIFRLSRASCVETAELIRPRVRASFRRPISSSRSSSR
jgi:phosphatidylglycerophosphate synthase